MRYLIIIFLISSQLFAFEKFLFKENIKFNEGDLYFKNFETIQLIVFGDYGPQTHPTAWSEDTLELA